MVERDTSRDGRKGASASAQVINKQEKHQAMRRPTEPIRHGIQKMMALWGTILISSQKFVSDSASRGDCRFSASQYPYHILNRKHNHIHAAPVSTQLRNMSPSVRRLMPGLSLCLVAAQLLCLMKALLRLDPLPQVQVLRALQSLPLIQSLTQSQIYICLCD